MLVISTVKSATWERPWTTGDAALACLVCKALKTWGLSSGVSGEVPGSVHSRSGGRALALRRKWVGVTEVECGLKVSSERNIAGLRFYFNDGGWSARVFQGWEWMWLCDWLLRGDWPVEAREEPGRPWRCGCSAGSAVAMRSGPGPAGQVSPEDGAEGLGGGSDVEGEGWVVLKGDG